MTVGKCSQLNFMALGYSCLFLLVRLSRTLQHEISSPARQVSHMLSQKFIFVKDN